MRLEQDKHASTNGLKFEVKLEKDDLEGPSDAFVGFIGTLGEHILSDGVTLGAFKSTVERLYTPLK